RTWPWFAPTAVSRGWYPVRPVVPRCAPRRRRTGRRVLDAPRCACATRPNGSRGCCGGLACAGWLGQRGSDAGAVRTMSAARRTRVPRYAPAETGLGRLGRCQARPGRNPGGLRRSAPSARQITQATRELQGDLRRVRVLFVLDEREDV